MFLPWFRNHRKFLIKTGYSCNNYCTFCHTEDFRPMVDDDTRAVLKKLLLAKQAGAEMIVFTGGEPTLRQDLFQLTAAVKKTGLPLGLVTNGRLLSVPDAFARLLDHGLRYTFISLHGATSATHNRLVVVNAYAQTLGGIRAVSAHNRAQTDPAQKIDLTVNCVVTQQNHHELKAMVDLLAPRGPLTFKLSYVEPKGGGLHAHDKLALPAPVAAEAMRAALQHAAQTAPGLVRVGVDGLTPCLFEGFEWVRDDLFTHGFVAMSETFEEKFFPVDSGKRHWLPPCENCGEKPHCPGVFADADPALFPVAPLPAPRANGANYFLNGVVAARKKGDCPLGLAARPFGGGAEIAVMEDQKIRRAVTDTADFSPEQLWKMVQGGQVYGCAEARFTGLDFEKQLQRLVLSPTCGDCAHQPVCSGCWAPGSENVFTVAEEKLSRLLGEISGDVLEVGAGEHPHGELVLSLLQNGRVTRYTAIEPAGEKPSWADDQNIQWLNMPVEAYVADEKFDTVVALRCLNHLRRPQAMLGRLMDYLKPGGLLLVAENNDFITVRSGRQRKQQPRLAQDGARHEHYHNLSSENVLSWLAVGGAQVVVHQPVTHDGANQWVVGVRTRV